MSIIKNLGKVVKTSVNTVKTIKESAPVIVEKVKTTGIHTVNLVKESADNAKEQFMEGYNS